MPITDDDWMHPSMSASSSWQAPEPKEQWLIEREKVIICTWMGDLPPTEWAHWASFDSREARDAELARLRETTGWHLRPVYKPLHGHSRVEDEEADLIRRLSEIRRTKKKT